MSFASPLSCKLSCELLEYRAIQSGKRDTSVMRDKVGLLLLLTVEKGLRLSIHQLLLGVE